MHNFKRIAAITLAAAMVLGGSFTAFAEESAGGDSTGIGTSEGHVDKKATNVVLPTIPEGSTPFAYTMDPERLITETSHEKYGDSVVFPESNSDTGVYFNNGKKGGDGSDANYIVYANTSLAQTVTNKSSHAVNLTVKAEATTLATDIPLVAEDKIADADDASLYLGLIVGTDDAVALSGTAAATKTVSIAGTAGNFKTAVEDGAYVYRALTLAEYQALDGNNNKTQDDYDETWETTTFQLEGSVTADKQITSTTTAPTVKVTWSWVDPENAAPSIATSGTYSKADGIQITPNMGGGTLAATSVSKVEVSKDNASWSEPTWTFENGIINISNTFNSASVGSTGYVRVTFNDTTGTKAIMEVTIAN